MSVETAAARGVMRPRVLLWVALAVGALSVVAVALRLGWVAGAVLTILAAAVIVVGPFIALRRASLVVAPLAIALVSLFNPVVLSGLSAHVTQLLGVVTFDRGLVLWGTYPGIAGWEAPDDVAVVDAGPLARQTQDATREVVDATSDRFGWSWSLGDDIGGSAPIPNGFGGDSVFVRVDSAAWSTSDFDGSAEQADGLLSALQVAADELALAEAADLDGDVSTGDGTRVWSDGLGGELTVTIDGSDVSFWYAGGPFSTIPFEEYQALLEPFEGLDQPAPIVEPDLP